MYKTILIPTDGSEHANIAVDHAVALAAQFGATLHILSVIDTRHLGITTPTELDVEQLRSAYRKQSEEAIDEAVRRATEADVSTVTDIKIGVPHRTITEYVDKRNIDLVVIGTHGRTRLRHTLLGSVAEQVVRTSSAPVLAVRADQQLVDD